MSSGGWSLTQLFLSFSFKNCRKLKNCLATQTDRDRKKARLNELEAQVEHLIEEKTKVEARCKAAEIKVALLETQLAQARSAIGVCSMCDQKKSGSSKRG